MAGTRAQSGDRYGSGTLHSRQFLRGRLPLLSPAFRSNKFIFPPNKTSWTTVSSEDFKTFKFMLMLIVHHISVVQCC
jgi:hypothetical protein